MKIKIYILTIIFIFNISHIFGKDIDKNLIYKNLRCLVCQGQSISDSNSDFAQTIKSVINDKLAEGMNERQIYSFLAEKYGDWILYKPPFKTNSYLLWMLPYVFFILGALILFLILRKNSEGRK